MKSLWITSLVGLTLLLFLGTACQSGAEVAESDDTSSKTVEFPVSTSSEAAMAEFNKGIALLDLPGDEEARVHFTKAIELDPEFAGAYLYRAYTAGSAAEGVPDIKEAQKYLDDATDGERLLAELMMTWLTNDREKRMEIAKNMVAAYPDVPRAQIVMGNQYLGRKDEDVAAARAAFQKAVDVSPDSYRAHRRLGSSYMYDEPKDYPKAIQHFNRLTELAPDNPDAYMRLGDCYRSQNDLSKAMTYYQQAAEVAPDAQLAYQFMGHTNSFLGNYEEARANYANAAQHDPDKGAVALRFAALTHLHEGNPQAAMDALMAHFNGMEAAGVPASRLDQRQLDAIDDCGWVAFHTGSAEQLNSTLELAKPVLSKVIADVGTDEAKNNEQASIYFWESLIALKSNDLETAGAKATAHKEMAMTSNDSRNLDSYHFLQGNIALEAKDYEQAIEHFSEISDDWIYAHYMLGKAYEAAGQQEEALAVYLKLVNHNFNGVGYALIRNELLAKVSPS
jgi:tetratricopeptide (TPR) repeat protein